MRHQWKAAQSREYVLSYQPQPKRRRDGSYCVQRCKQCGAELEHQRLTVYWATWWRPLFGVRVRIFHRPLCRIPEPPIGM